MSMKNTLPQTLNRDSVFHLKEMNSVLFFSLLVVYQIAFIFQGVDVGDSGSYANFYQLIFKSPDSVQYSFMFWLSGVFGALYMKLFPGLGIWGLRLLGVLVSTSTLLIAYQLLKKYLNKGHLQLSLLILVLFINNNPKEFYYNNFSSLIYLLVAWSLFTGLRDHKLLPLFFSGALVALNVFNRVPNILALGIMAGIIYYGYLYHTGYKRQLKQCVAFIAGFLACTGLVLLVMHLMGHLKVYVNSLKIVFAMGQKTKLSDGTDADYGIANLLKLLYWQYKFSFIAATLFFVFVLVFVPIFNYLKTKFPFIVTKHIFSRSLLLLLMLALIISGKIDNIIMIYFFTGICLMSAAAIFITNKNKEISLLMFLGIFIAVVHPMGSSTGIHTVIIYSLWLAFPIALEYLLTISSVRIDLNLSAKFADFNSKLVLSDVQLTEIKKTGCGIVIFACLFQSFFYPYFDRHNRLDMHYPIHNKYMGGIFTTKERASALNELLQESAKYVKPDDYVLAYDNIPLYHYLTETKPYLRNSWPWLYQPDVFKAQLEKSETEIKPLPVVIFQIIRTNGSVGGRWPDYSLKETTLNWNLSKTRNEILNDFLSAHHYREVWSNQAFKILIPDKTTNMK